jgi:hypothetical protein
MGRRDARTSVLSALPLAVTLALTALAAPSARAQEPPVGPPPEVPTETPPAAPAPPPPAAPAPPPLAAPPETPAAVPAPTPPGAPAATQPAVPAPEPPETLVEVLPTPPPPRPRFSLAVGMGASFDSTGFPDGAHALPAFYGVGGFGDGLLGFDLGAFSSSASGRFTSPDQLNDAPVDRLALDAFGVIRPAARVHRDDTQYGYRVLHTLAAELGLGLERDGRTMVSGSRFEVHTGARIEFPLTPAGMASQLRLRLAVRRAFGLYTPEVAVAPGNTAVTSVGDSTEVYAALAVVF